MQLMIFWVRPGLATEEAGLKVHLFLVISREVDPLIKLKIKEISGPPPKALKKKKKPKAAGGSVSSATLLSW